MKNPTIIHINMASSFGGGEVQTLNLIEQLTDFNQLILGKKKSPFKAEVESKFKDQSNIQLSSFLSIFKYCLNHKNTIVHAHDGRGAHFARIISIFTGVKYIISRRVDKSLKGKVSEKTYKNSSVLVAVSKKVATNLEGLNADIRVIHDSYSNLSSSPTVMQRLNTLEGKFIITQLGSLLEVKNVGFTIELAKRLEVPYPHIHFLIVGDGKEELRLKEQAEGLSNITFFGFTPYVASILKLTNLLFMPSKSEGLGSAVLEAYQHNIPVITSNVGGLPEIVNEGKTGYQFELEDIEMAENRLVTLATNKTLYKDFVVQVTKEKDKYSPKKMAQSYIKCYQDCLFTKF